jgi:hypothetical protein
MSDTYSDADSISDSSNAHVDVTGDEALIPVAVRELCNQLRANDPDPRFLMALIGVSLGIGRRN